MSESPAFSSETHPYEDAIPSSGSPAQIVLSNSTKLGKPALAVCWKTPQLFESFLSRQSSSMPSYKRFSQEHANG